MVTIDHIGIAVEELGSAEAIFKDILGVGSSHHDEIESEMVKVSVFNAQAAEIELLEGTSPQSPIKRFLADKKGGGIHHIAFSVDDLKVDLDRLKAKGYQLISGYPRKGKGGSLVAFLHPKSTSGVLIELVQRKK